MFGCSDEVQKSLCFVLVQISAQSQFSPFAQTYSNNAQTDDTILESISNDGGPTYFTEVEKREGKEQ